ncbi:DUF447 domain-containing protein [uncultured Thiodictyon sp.]|uniref:DUF447 domain-containing protein n=1 Tax=uncultured Thiodictyon sp. TaxID=1846217 RepID=UPI0025FB1260|nr:DUF447 domain-containing protein [uncultured Thiodictyon sp.]
MIQEVIITTRHPDGRPHMAPMGVRHTGRHIVIAPFRPSTTLDNLLAGRAAVVNYTDDVRVFAGCLSGRRDWPLVDAQHVPVSRLAECLAHTEVELETVKENPERPRLICRPVFSQTHSPFMGFNRAQASVLELAILVSRLDRLPMEQVLRVIDYLRIAVDKTAGPREQDAWDWLIEQVVAFQANAANRQGGT